MTVLKNYQERGFKKFMGFKEIATTFTPIELYATYTDTEASQNP